MRYTLIAGWIAEDLYLRFLMLSTSLLETQNRSILLSHCYKSRCRGCMESICLFVPQDISEMYSMTDVKTPGFSKVHLPADCYGLTVSSSAELFA
jgi:hypothetical protein